MKAVIISACQPDQTLAVLADQPVQNPGNDTHKTADSAW